MGRTVPSYRLASEREKRKWKVFREKLSGYHHRHQESLLYSVLFCYHDYSIRKPISQVDEQA
jgi:hypothetical protein